MISNIQKKHKLIEENGMKYYTIDGMNLVHEEMLRLLKIIDEIANNNNISYWIAGGSMIGVARHQGFIPWDDDLDIELLKLDYIKLIKCLTDYSNSHDDVFIYYPAPQEYHCCNYFASNKFFLRCQGAVSVFPVKVDIRPYNCIQNSKTDVAKNEQMKDIANRLVFGKSHGIVSDEKFSSIDSKDFFKFYNSDYGLYDATKSDAILVPPYFEYSMDFEFKYTNLFPLTRKKFEDTYTNMPKEFDYILKSIYGDYMNLPRIQHRVPASCELYCKEIPVETFKKCYLSSSKGLFAKLRKIRFLTQLYGFLPLLRIVIQERKVVMSSNYEDANW